MVTIGILALQGAFREHEEMLDKINVGHFLIRKASDLHNPMDGLIIPGGESTTIGKLLVDLELLDDLRKMIFNGMPVFGTCAGMILLANSLSGDKARHLGVMDICVKRNAYGRQLGSFFCIDKFGETNIPMTFIRAPFIESVGNGIEILSRVDGHIVAAKQRNMLVTSFHPELTEDVTVHSFFYKSNGNTLCA
ncbi:MAG: pyridoxal 5'-phosphate synthase glutaminase subunit PdxT [Muribaculaceae bacterium]